MLWCYAVLCCGACYLAVAPKFKDSFKEDMDWREIYQTLAATGVKQVDAAEAYAKCKRCASRGSCNRVTKLHLSGAQRGSVVAVQCLTSCREASTSLAGIIISLAHQLPAVTAC